MGRKEKESLKQENMGTDLSHQGFQRLGGGHKIRTKSFKFHIGFCLR